jgi:hypothetical protein
MARTKLITCNSVDPATGGVRVYANGEKDTLQTLLCYGAQQIYDEEIFRFVLEREYFRLYGAKPGSLIYGAMDIVHEDPLGVFTKKVGGDTTIWRNLAAFANFYWWLNPTARRELENDIIDGNARWAEAVIDWARPRTPAAVMNDPIYAQSDPMIGAHDVNDFGFADTEGIWPVEFPDGTPFSIQGLPTPCEPFPQCVVDALGIPLDTLWNIVKTIAGSTSGVVQVRDADGLLYNPTAAPSMPVATDADAEKAGVEGDTLAEGEPSSYGVLAVLSVTALGAIAWALWPRR